MLLAFTVCKGQTNPLPGFILTLEGDTVRGTIDYRSDSHNASVCKFQKAGETTFHDYHPEDITCYRIDDNGAYYVSIVLPLQGKDQRLFALYLLQGGVDLYYVKHNGLNYYYVIGENGEVAEICDYERSGLSTEDALTLRRQNLSAAGSIFSKDFDTVHKLWKGKNNAHNLTELVRDYNEKYCATAGECIIYQYDEAKTAPFTNKWFLEIGGGFSSMKLLRDNNDISLPSSIYLNGPTLYLALCNDVTFGRVSKKFDLQTIFRANFFHVSKDKHKAVYLYPEILIGPKYKFSSNDKYTPFIRAGLTFNCFLGIHDEKELDSYVLHKHGFLERLFGYYGGLGIDIHTEKRDYRLSANFNSFSFYSGSYFVTIGLGMSL